MKKTENKLFLEMAIFFLIVVLCFGLLIIKEKGESFRQKNIDKKITQYIESNYKDLKKEFKYSKLEYKNNTYYKKIYNNKNKDLNFLISYQNKKISSSYEEDYLEGKSLFNILEKNMNDRIKSFNTDNYYSTLKIKYNVKLNNCTDNVKNRLIKGDYDLSIYTIIDRKTINLDKESIQTEIIKLYNYVLSLNLNPKNYEVTYTDLGNETKSIIISFNQDLLINNIDIGRIVIENNEKMFNQYNIKVKYLN